MPHDASERVESIEGFNKLGQLLDIPTEALEAVAKAIALELKKRKAQGHGE